MRLIELEPDLQRVARQAQESEAADFTTVIRRNALPLKFGTDASLLVAVHSPADGFMHWNSVEIVRGYNLPGARSSDERSLTKNL